MSLQEVDSSRRIQSLLWIGLLLTTYSHSETTTTEHGGRYVIDNGLVRCQIDSAKGATLVSFQRTAVGRELLAGPSFQDSNILPGRRIQSLASLSFANVAKLSAGDRTGWRMSTNLPKEMEIDFSEQMVGRVGEAITYNPAAVLEWPRPYETLKLTKTFTLTDGSTALVVDYEVENRGKQPVVLCLGTSHSLAGSRFCVSTREGVVAETLPISSPETLPLLEHTMSPWLYDVSSAWTAMLKSVGGIAGAFDPRHISFVQPDFSSGRFFLGRTRIRIEPGKTLRTSGWLMPTQHSARVTEAQNMLLANFEVSPAKSDGAASLERKEFSEMLPTKLDVGISLGDQTEKHDQGLAADSPKVTNFNETELSEEEKLLAELEGEEALLEARKKYGGKPISVNFLLESARSRKVEVSFRSRRHRPTRPETDPTNAWKDLFKKSVDLKAGRVSPIRLEIAPSEVGTYLVEATVSENGKVVARFDHPVVAEKPSGFYMPKGVPLEGEVNREYFYHHVQGVPMWPFSSDWKPSTEIERPHFDFATPLSGGPLKTLFIAPHHRSREIVELAHRLELDFDCVTTGVRGYFPKTGGRKRAAIDEIELCRSYLNQPHEVIVLPIFVGKWLPLDIVEEIARQVREEGVGLVLPLPEKLYGSFATFSEKATGEDCPKNFRRADVGKGRVVFLDGVSQELFTNWMCGTTKMTENEVSHFAKMLLWAAGRTPQISIELESPTQTVGLDRSSGPIGLTFKIRNQSDRRFTGRLQVIARQELEKDYPFHPRAEMLRSYRVCRLWEERGNAEKPISLSAGEEISIPLSIPLPAGHFSLDSYALDASGATDNWERFPVQFDAGPSIKSVRLISGVRTPREIDLNQLTDPVKDLLFSAKPSATLNLEFRLANASSIERVDLVATDPWDRTVANIVKRVEAGKDSFSVSFSVPLHSCLHRVLIVSMRAFDAGGCVQDRRLCGFIHPRPERRPAYELRAYADASEVDRSITGYDARVGATPFSRSLLHAWYNVSVQGWFDGPPTMDRVSFPGEVLEELPDLPQVGAISNADKTGAVEEEPDDVDIAIEERKPVDPRDGWVRFPCINAPRLRTAIHDSIRGTYEMHSFFGPFSGGWGDEWYVTKQGGLGDELNPWRREFVPGKDTNSCRCEHCLTGFRAHARQLFNDDLDALNSEWTTAFKTWEDVDRPIINKTMEDKAAPPETVWPYFLAHRRFDDYMVAEMVKAGRDAAKGVDEHNRYGWGDVFKTSLVSGTDAYLMSQYCDNNQLDRDQIKWASFGTSTNAHWTGYHKKYSEIRENFTPWWMMFEGNSAITYYGKSGYPMHRQDYTFHEAPKEMFRSMHEIRGLGFDKLLVGHQQFDPVAIHYDPSSIYMAQIEDWQRDADSFIAAMRNGGRSYMEVCHQIETTVKGLLSQTGLRHFATAYGQLEEGHFGRFGTPRLLFLPYTQCISPKQAATLEKFVREGGVLVGDIHTGLRNGHGRRLERGLLDHVFGIKRVDSKQAGRVYADDAGNAIPVKFGAEFGKPFELVFGAVGPGDVATDTARVLATYSLNGEFQPAFLVNSFGKGKAVYLNFAPTGFRVVENEGRGDEEEERIRELKGLAAAHFKSVFDKLVGYAQLTLPVNAGGAMLWRYGNDGATYVCLGAGYKGDPEKWRRPYQITLNEKRHVYDSRRRTYIGFTDRFEANFSLEDNLLALVYATMPYKVEDIDITLDSKTVNAGDTLFFDAQIKANVPEAVRHVFSLSVSDPNGENVRWYGTAMEAPKGRVRGRVDFATNDTPGVWKLKLTDTATGVTKEFSVTVVSKNE